MTKCHPRINRAIPKEIGYFSSVPFSPSGVKVIVLTLGPQLPLTIFGAGNAGTSESAVSCDFAPRMIREVRLRLALKYKREYLTALQLEKFMTSILARIDLERTASTKKLKADVAERPGYNELGDPRTVETERGETQWTR